MRRLFIAALLAVLLGTPAGAAIWSTTCTAALVAAEVCPAAQQGNTVIVVTFSMTPSQGQRVRDGVAAKFGWTPTVTCTQARVDAGHCTAGELGNTIANPETEEQLFLRKLRQVVRSWVIQTEYSEARNAIVVPTIPLDDRSEADDEDVRNGPGG